MNRCLCKVTFVQKCLFFTVVRLNPPGHFWLHYIFSNMLGVGLWIEMCPPIHGLVWPALVRILEEGEGPGPGVGAWRGVRSCLLSNSSSLLMSGHRVWALWGGATGRTIPRWHVQTGPSFRGRQCRARILRSAAVVWLEILGFLTHKIFVVRPKSIFGPLPLLLPLGSAVLKPNLEQKENKWKWNRNKSSHKIRLKSQWWEQTKVKESKQRRHVRMAPWSQGGSLKEGDLPIAPW